MVYVTMCRLCVLHIDGLCDDVSAMHMLHVEGLCVGYVCYISMVYVTMCRLCVLHVNGLCDDV